MKILQLCHKVPFPPKDGGCIAMNNLTQGLINEGNQVKVLAINTKKHFTDIEQLPSDYKSKTEIEAVFVDTRIKAIPAFLNLFSKSSYNIQRFYSKEFEAKLIEVLKKESFDIIQLESLYVSVYVRIIRDYSKAKIVLRAHNVEHLLWERNSKAADNLFENVYFNFLAKRLKQYEINVLQTVDAIAAITEEDELFFKNAGFEKQLETFPFGVDLENIELKAHVDEEFPSLFHIGAMDWQPNIEGVNWFLNNVWDKISVQYPQLKIYLAGRGMRDELKTLKRQNVIIIGEVDNAYGFMQSKGLMIAPLLSGGGMRVKIIEGMVLGKTIITTTIGAEGIKYENNKNIIIADTEVAFADAISKCITDKKFYNATGVNAKSLAMQQYDNAAICKRLTQFYQHLISN